jgi:hypothetical protein
MSLTYNNFKSTTVRGNFHNADDTTNSIIANAVFDRDIHVGGNIIIGTQDLLNLLKQLTYTMGYGVKLSTDYPTSSIADNSQGYQCYWNDIHPGYGQTDFLNYSQAGVNGGFTFNTMQTNSSGNAPIQLISLCVNNSTFSNRIICPSLTLNGIDLATKFNDYVLTSTLSNYALTSTFSNYVLTSSLNNLTISTLTFNPSVSVKQLMFFNLNSSNIYDNLCISVEPNMIRYNVNDPYNDCHVFSSANGTSNGFTEIFRLKSTGSTLNNRLTVPSITLNGVDLATTLSTFLTSTPSLTGYANLTATSNTFTGNAIFSTGNVDIGTVNSPMTQYLDVYSVATFMKIATFQGGLIADTMVFNSADLQTTLDTFVTNTSLTTLLSNYITSSSLTTSLSNYVTNTSLTTSLSNYVTNSSLTTSLSNLTHTWGLGFNASTFPTNSSGDFKTGYEVFWNNSNGIGEVDFLSYGQGGLGGFKFYSLCASSTIHTPHELLSTDLTNGTVVNTNFTVKGIQNSCRKSITYLNSSGNFYLSTSNITAYYLVTNNSSITFNCFAPTQNITDGYEISIRNNGTGVITITGCVPVGNANNILQFYLPQYQSCKIVSGNDNWYQI